MTDTQGKRDFQKWFCCCVYNHNVKSNPLRFLAQCLSFYQKLVLPDMYAYLPVLPIIQTIKSRFWICFYCVSSVQSHSRVPCGPHVLQHTKFPCPSPTPRFYSNSGPSGWWCHPTISSSVFSSTLSPPSFTCFQHQGLFKWVSSSHQVAKVLDFQL